MGWELPTLTGVWISLAVGVYLLLSIVLVVIVEFV